MARYTLKNKENTIAIDTHGAELRSFLHKGKELMWQADPAYWGRTSPVLFPLIGRLVNNEYRLEGNTYPLFCHGFARDKEFSLVEQTETKLCFRLQEDEETRKVYPYAFLLDITYTLEKNALTIGWTVSNPEQKPLHFSLGGHPAFCCEPEGYRYHLYRKKQDTYLPLEHLTFQQLNGAGNVLPEQKTYATPDGELPITKELFLNDALLCLQTGVKRVCLADATNQEYLQVDFDADIFGMWSPAGKSAPFVCIEPWYGLADAASFTGSWEERPYANVVTPGNTFQKSMTITAL